jgi:hypothetical protein
MYFKAPKVVLQNKSKISFFYWGPLYDLPHQFGSANLIKTTFGDLALKYVPNLAFILCPFT